MNETTPAANDAKSVLWVDDDAYVRHATCLRLRIDGYEVTEVDNVDDAMKIMSQKAFDFAIFDLMMSPGEVFADLQTYGGLITGIMLAQSMKLLHPTTSIIVYSLASSRHIPTHLLSAIKGASWLTYVPKSSSDADELFDRIVRSKNAVKGTHESAVISVFDAMRLEPSFMGIGVDLKKLLSIVRHIWR